MILAILASLVVLASCTELNFIDAEGNVHSYSESETCQRNYLSITVLPSEDFEYTPKETECVIVYYADVSFLKGKYRYNSIEKVYGPFYENVLDKMRMPFSVTVKMQFEGASTHFQLRGDGTLDRYNHDKYPLLILTALSMIALFAGIVLCHQETLKPEKSE